MAGDRQKYNQAKKKWQSLKKSESFSVPESEGRAGIITTHYPWHRLNGTGRKIASMIRDSRDWKEFDIEALAIAYDLKEANVDTVVALDATPSEVDDIISDSKISDIFIIGHGNLCGAFVLNCVGNTYDWFRASSVSTHLKTGNIIQRHCGSTDRNINIPLGMFIAEKPNKVLAPLCEGFFPTNAYDYRGIRSITEAGPIDTYDKIKNTFAYTPA